jgi:hypothetical protein
MKIQWQRKKWVTKNTVELHFFTYLVSLEKSQRDDSNHILKDLQTWL